MSFSACYCFVASPRLKVTNAVVKEYFKVTSRDLHQTVEETNEKNCLAEMLTLIFLNTEQTYKIFSHVSNSTYFGLT
jgi:hypothetical protein